MAYQGVALSGEWELAGEWIEWSCHIGNVKLNSRIHFILSFEFKITSCVIADILMNMV